MRIEELIARADTAVPVPDVWPRIAAVVAPPPPIRLSGWLFQDIKARLVRLTWRDRRAG